MTKHYILAIVALISFSINAQKSLGFVFNKDNFKRVNFIFKKSPSDLAGMMPGDSITKINGDPLFQENVDEFMAYLRNFPDVVEFEVYRAGSTKRITVTKAEVTSFINKCVEGDCTNGTGIINSNTFSYEGSFSEGKKNGTGVLYLNNGNVYSGEFFNDVAEGKGKITFPNGNVYNGKFSNGSAVGRGRMKYANGDKYEGEFSDFKRQGNGILLYISGAEYEGNFANDMRFGPGKMTQADHFVYEGMFANDLYEGQGKMIYPEGHIYEGNFKKGLPDGPGKMTYANGDKYEGLYTDWEKTGKGKYWFQSGQFYEGEFKADRKNGYGKYIQADNFIYEGMFVNDAFEGKGQMTYPDGHVYTGSFKNGLPDGPGKMEYSSGDVYEGLYTNWEKTGVGKFWYKDGRYYEGDFKKDLKDGKGKFTWPNGDYYEGDFLNDLRDGMGKYYDKANDTTEENMWGNDEVLETPLIKVDNNSNKSDGLQSKINDNPPPKELVDELKRSQMLEENVNKIKLIVKDAESNFLKYKGVEESKGENGYLYYEYKGPVILEAEPTLFSKTSNSNEQLILLFNFTGEKKPTKKDIDDIIGQLWLEPPYTSNLLSIDRKMEGDWDTDYFAYDGFNFMSLAENMKTGDIMLGFYGKKVK